MLPAEQRGISQPVTGDMKLVATWKTVPIYTVKFSYSENAEPMTVKVTKGNTVTPPGGLTSDGMILAGWELNGVPYVFSTPITNDITMTAIWVPVPTPDAYVIPAGLLNIVLNSAGQVTKLINTLDGTDYVTTVEQQGVVSDVPDCELCSAVSNSDTLCKRERDLNFGFCLCKGQGYRKS